MYPLLGECPVCHGELAVTTLTCRECDTQIQGRFSAGPFSQLSPQQLEFVELFVRNEGKITRMEAELSLSYPTIRNRLHEIIRALGYEPGGEEASGLSEEDRRKILTDLENGKIDYEEAMRLLKESE
ncbi:MAG: DUF2089 domain-containing protein [Anaerolineae bacterium]|nr:MAG: DUF2089 domain-containing protein [Anaerolineae bacterium]